MSSETKVDHLPIVGDGSGLARDESFLKEEVQLALRNRGIPLEGLRYPITPTGMHYLLVHFDIPWVDAGDWRLRIGGLVSRPVELTLDDIKRRPATTIAVTMECAGNGRGLLKEAGLTDKAVEIVFTGVDRGIQGGVLHNYQRGLRVDDAMREEVLLGYEMNSEPLQPQHGYPLRLIVPGWYGMTSVKWLESIEATDRPFEGYQVAHTYRYTQSADEPGEPVTLMRVRALMTPPGIPDFMTRTRLVDPGRLTLTGRAWAGRVGISRVEVSVNGGISWSAAELEEPVSPFAWRGWSFAWKATSGRHTLCVRAADDEGDVQPMTQQWNFQGMGNNMVQRLDVLVE